MAYTEPYPVVTSLDWVNDSYKEGDRVCYHFTLTYDQVVANLKSLNVEIPKMESYGVPMEASLVLGLMGFAVPAAGVTGLTLAIYDAILSQGITYLKQIQSAYVSIYRHMGEIGYKRVTISQKFQVHRVDHQGLMLNYWNPIGPIYVPVESYYYKY